MKLLQIDEQLVSVASLPFGGQKEKKTQQRLLVDGPTRPQCQPVSRTE